MLECVLASGQRDVTQPWRWSGGDPPNDVTPGKILLQAKDAAAVWPTGAGCYVRYGAAAGAAAVSVVCHRGWRQTGITFRPGGGRGGGAVGAAGANWPVWSAGIGQLACVALTTTYFLHDNT